MTEDHSHLKRGQKRQLPRERDSKIRRFYVGGHGGYMTTGFYPNGDLAELSLCISKEGSTVRGLTDAFAIAVSLGLQYGVPLAVFCEKFSHIRFDPSGPTGDPDIPHARSIIDYVFRKLAQTHLPVDLAEKVMETPSTLTSPLHPATMSDDAMTTSGVDE